MATTRQITAVGLLRVNKPGTNALRIGGIDLTEFDALDFLEAHPEVKSARLIWMWAFDVENDEGEFSGNCLDYEYSFIGDREHLEAYLQHYSCWDSILENSRESGYLRREWSIIDGLLECEHEEENWPRHVDDSLPDDYLIVMRWDEAAENWVVILDREPDGYFLRED